MTYEEELRTLRAEARRYRVALEEAHARWPETLPPPLAWIPDALAETKGRIRQINAAMRDLRIADAFTPPDPFSRKV